MPSLLQNHTTILFQGDGVTDAGRSQINPNGLGFGYAAILADWIKYHYPERKINFINRGVAGDRIEDMAARWNKDCIQFSPNILTIMIGINHTRDRFLKGEPTPTAHFEKTYRLLLDSTIRNTRTRILLLSPFLLPIHVDHMVWRGDLYEKMDVIQKLASEYSLSYIPLHKIFSQLIENGDHEASYWSGDGIHPTYAGHLVIARELLKALGETIS